MQAETTGATISTRCPSRSPPLTCSARHGDRTASIVTAAVSNGNESAMGRTFSAFASTYSARPPSRSKPIRVMFGQTVVSPAAHQRHRPHAWMM
ncbi:hypothetical protein BJF78_07240 [Pseudonocardia sp. CNS-139]|nr:hypothetical protein BJF78_07240 [Pseudonocardia sp. CNS-139]